MREEWIDYCLRACRKKATFYSGARKVIRQQVVVFDTWENDLHIEDAGYTKTKMNLLRKGYLHEESRDMALILWERRLGQRKYGSVGFSTYNHLLKNDIEKKSKRASVMGPCIQAVNLTLLNNGRTAVDVYYRTTEIFKKFPADLVFLREVLLDGFEMDLETVTFYFANVTVHPMYFVTIVPHLSDPIAQMEYIRAKDKYFFDWLVKWTARYVCEEHHRGIDKFAQALRVKMDAEKRIGVDMMQELGDYLRENHPGHRNEYEESDDEE